MPVSDLLSRAVLSFASRAPLRDTGGMPDIDRVEAAHAAEPPRPRARERARERVRSEALDIAARQLADVGAAALSVRAVARELGMVSSAIYRYFPSRDALLTALIVDAYTELGETATRAEAAAPRDDYRARFAALAHAVRGWALENRHRYALIYGSPVPGYAAPQDTVAPASMVSLLIASVFQDAVAAGHRPVVTPAMTASADLVEPLKRYFEIDAAGELVMVVIFAFTNLFGTVSFELFGHLDNTTGDADRWFEIVIDELAGRLGL